MLMDNLDPEVAERPEELVVYGSIGRAARDWDCYDKIVEVLVGRRRIATGSNLANRSVSKPDGSASADRHPTLYHTGPTGNLQPAHRQGLMMYGQMTAGSWSISATGIVQGPNLCHCCKQHFFPKARPLDSHRRTPAAWVELNYWRLLWPDLICRAIECDESRIDKRLETGYLDHRVTDLDAALQFDRNCLSRKAGNSVGLPGNCAKFYLNWSVAKLSPMSASIVTSAHDPLNGYLVGRLEFGKSGSLRHKAARGD